MSKMISSNYLPDLKRLQAFWGCLFLAVVFWIARYWHMPHFGMYEDDITIIPLAVPMSFSELLRFIFDYITNFYGHARPLSDSFIYFFTNLGWRFADLQGAYLFGYAIEVVNLCLFYILLRRLMRPTYALLGGLGYALYAADTTQAFLTHSLGLQPSLTFLLLALHSYLSRKGWLAYGLVVIILFSYETPFLVFLAAPLLLEWDRRLMRRLFLHGFILGGMLSVVILLRSLVGEERVTEIGLFNALLTPFLHMLQGPLVSLGAFLYRPIQAIQSFSVEVGVVVVLATALFSLLLQRVQWPKVFSFYPTLPGLVSEIRSRIKGQKWESISEADQRLLQLLTAGMAMLVLAYPLTFTVRALVVTGRETRVHAAGVVGAGLLFACLVAILVGRGYRSPGITLAKVLLALILALQMGYGFVIQRDYVLAWQYQKTFWAEILKLAPDLEYGVLILVEPSGLQDTLQIGANTWNVPRMFNHIYHFPPQWNDPPRVYRLVPGWEQLIGLENGALRMMSTTALAPASLYRNLDSWQAVVIETEGGVFRRRTGSLLLNGQEYPLRGPATFDSRTTFEKGFLYPYLLGDQ